MSGSDEVVSELETDANIGKGLKEKRKRITGKSKTQVKEEEEASLLDITDKNHDTESSSLSLRMEKSSTRSMSIANKKVTQISLDEEKPVYPRSGDICAFCYCGKNSLLGQGDIAKYDPTPNFNPFRLKLMRSRFSGSRDSTLSPGIEAGDRSSKSPIRGRSREKRYSQESNSRQSENVTFEVPEELSKIGTLEIADPVNVFEPTGHVVAHHCCAAWSEGVTQNEQYALLCVDKAVHFGLSQKCHYCNRYGATIKCKAYKCERFFHYPCAAGSGCYQDIKAVILFCPDHLEQAVNTASTEAVQCTICSSIGKMSDFLFCTGCGQHYHANCLEPSVSISPVVRAGWQCPDCKICQTCRLPGDDYKMLVCDICDKGYHTYCLEPAIKKIPKNGWCCQVCESCTQSPMSSNVCQVCCKNHQYATHGLYSCHKCKKMVHHVCDDVADYEEATYLCPGCRSLQQQPALIGLPEAIRAAEQVPGVVEEMETEEIVPPADSILDQSMASSATLTADEGENTVDPITSVASSESCVKDMAFEETSEAFIVKVKQELPSPSTTTTPASSVGRAKLNIVDSDTPMKGSSNDPMLCTTDESACKSEDKKIAISSGGESKVLPVSTESVATTTTVGPVVEVGVRKPSLENRSVYTDTSDQESLGLFSGEAYQPMPTLFCDDNNKMYPQTAASSVVKTEQPQQVSAQTAWKTKQATNLPPSSPALPTTTPTTPLVVDDEDDDDDSIVVDTQGSETPSTVATPPPFSTGADLLAKNTAAAEAAVVAEDPSTLILTTAAQQAAVVPRSHGKGKPENFVGKGKSMIAKGGRKRPTSTSRGKRGKACRGGKGRRGGGTKRSRPGSTSNCSSNVPSPTSSSTSSTLHHTNMLASSGTSMRRRVRATRLQQKGTATEQALTDKIDNGHDSVDEEYGESMHNTVVLCSADDSFVLSQDMCVVCGSFGRGPEGRLVACFQCGQCYHPYCVDLKLSRVVLRKGWRCLDCTVCEECGAVDGENNLLLCDDCDVSYHTYCLQPPLQTVPKGGWKCKWCVRCIHCNATSPGVNCDWQDNYSSCGRCASKHHCPWCKRPYREEDIVLQCSHCERWLHGSCEHLTNEIDVERVMEKGYVCVMCRPKDSTPPHLDLNPPQITDVSSEQAVLRPRVEQDPIKEFQKDGIGLTSAGLLHIQQLMQKSMGMAKKKPPAPRKKTQTKAQKLAASLSTEDKTSIAGAVALPALLNPQLANTNLPSDCPTLTCLIKNKDSTNGNNAAAQVFNRAAFAPNKPGYPIFSNLPGGDGNTTAVVKAGGGENDALLGLHMMYENYNMGVQPNNNSNSSQSLMMPVAPGSGSSTTPATPTDLATFSQITAAAMDESSNPDKLAQADGKSAEKATKRRRKPYRPGIGGFVVRARGSRTHGTSNYVPRGSGGRKSAGRGSTKDRGSGASVPASGAINAAGFDITLPSTMDVKLRASAITEENELSYIKHESEGGITIAHDESNSTASTIRDDDNSFSLTISSKEGKTPIITKPKRKRRVRLSEQFPGYIQEGFFGNFLLDNAKHSGVKPNDILMNVPKLGKPSETAEDNEEEEVGGSRITLPERVRQQFEARLQKNVKENIQNSRNKMMEHQQHHHHHEQSNINKENNLLVPKTEGKDPQQQQKTLHENDGSIMDKESSIIDKESEQDLLQALEHDLPIKEDELEDLIDQLKHDKGDFVPSGFEGLVEDSFANMDGASLFSQDANQIDPNILGDLASIDDKDMHLLSDTKSSSSKRKTESAGKQQPQQSTGTSNNKGKVMFTNQNIKEEARMQPQKQAVSRTPSNTTSATTGTEQQRRQQQQQAHTQQQQQPSFIYPTMDRTLNRSQQGGNVLGKGQMQTVQLGAQQQQKMVVTGGDPSFPHQNPQEMQRQHQMQQQQQQRQQQQMMKSNMPTGQFYMTQQSMAQQQQMLSTSSAQQKQQGSGINTLPQSNTNLDQFQQQQQQQQQWSANVKLGNDVLNEKTCARLEADEKLAHGATVPYILFGNIKYPHLKKEILDPSQRFKKYFQLWNAHATHDEKNNFTRVASENQNRLKQQGARNDDAGTSSDHKDPTTTGNMYHSQHTGIKSTDYNHFVKPNLPSRSETPVPMSPAAGPLVKGNKGNYTVQNVQIANGSAQQQHQNFQNKYRARMKLNQWPNNDYEKQLALQNASVHGSQPNIVGKIQASPLDVTQQGRNHQVLISQSGMFVNTMKPDMQQQQQHHPGNPTAARFSPVVGPPQQLPVVNSPMMVSSPSPAQHGKLQRTSSYHEIANMGSPSPCPSYYSQNPSPMMRPMTPVSPHMINQQQQMHGSISPANSVVMGASPSSTDRTGYYRGYPAPSTPQQLDGSEGGGMVNNSPSPNVQQNRQTIDKTASIHHTTKLNRHGNFDQQSQACTSNMWMASASRNSDVIMTRPPPPYPSQGPLISPHQTQPTAVGAVTFSGAYPTQVLGPNINRPRQQQQQRFYMTGNPAAVAIQGGIRIRQSVPVGIGISQAQAMQQISSTANLVNTSSGMMERFPVIKQEAVSGSNDHLQHHNTVHTGRFIELRHSKHDVDASTRREQIIKAGQVHPAAITIAASQSQPVSTTRSTALTNTTGTTQAAHTSITTSASPASSSVVAVNNSASSSSANTNTSTIKSNNKPTKMTIATGRVVTSAVSTAAAAAAVSAPTTSTASNLMMSSVKTEPNDEGFASSANPPPTTSTKDQNPRKISSSSTKSDEKKTEESVRKTSGSDDRKSENVVAADEQQAVLSGKDDSKSGSRGGSRKSSRENKEGSNSRKASADAGKNVENNDQTQTASSEASVPASQPIATTTQSDIAASVEGGMAFCTKQVKQEIVAKEVEKEVEVEVCNSKSKKATAVDKKEVEKTRSKSAVIVTESSTATAVKAQATRKSDELASAASASMPIDVINIIQGGGASVSFDASSSTTTAGKVSPPPIQPIHPATFVTTLSSAKDSVSATAAITTAGGSFVYNKSSPAITGQISVVTSKIGKTSFTGKPICGAATQIRPTGVPPPSPVLQIPLSAASTPAILPHHPQARLPSSVLPTTNSAGIYPMNQTSMKPKTLLVKEQPLLLQDLLDQEKKEQERARQEKLNQTIMQQHQKKKGSSSNRQQQQQQPIYSGVDTGDKSSGADTKADLIHQVKVTLLSGINQKIINKAAADKEDVTSTATPNPLAVQGSFVQGQLPATAGQHRASAICPPPTANKPGLAGEKPDPQKTHEYKEWLSKHNSLIQNLHNESESSSQPATIPRPTTSIAQHAIIPPKTLSVSDKLVMTSPVVTAATSATSKKQTANHQHSIITAITPSVVATQQVANPTAVGGIVEGMDANAMMQTSQLIPTPKIQQKIQNPSQAVIPTPIVVPPPPFQQQQQQQQAVAPPQHQMSGNITSLDVSLVGVQQVAAANQMQQSNLLQQVLEGRQQQQQQQQQSGSVQYQQRLHLYMLQHQQQQQQEVLPEKPKKRRKSKKSKTETATMSGMTPTQQQQQQQPGGVTPRQIDVNVMQQQQQQLQVHHDSLRTMVQPNQQQQQQQQGFVASQSIVPVPRPRHPYAQQYSARFKMMAGGQQQQQQPPPPHLSQQLIVQQAGGSTISAVNGKVTSSGDPQHDKTLFMKTQEILASPPAATQIYLPRQPLSAATAVAHPHQTTTINSVDETIEGVLREGVDYVNRLENSKLTGAKVIPPKWLAPNQHPSPLLLHTNQPPPHQQEGGNHSTQLIRNGGCGSRDESGKKKRVNRTTKEKKPKQRKKQKYPEEFSSTPAIQLSQSKDINLVETSVQKTDWTPLKLVEPEIKTNYNMCMPKGTGLVQSESLLEGDIGSSTFRGLPDYYDLIFTKDPLCYLQPPTPPYSLPPSPKRERLDSMEPRASDPEGEGNKSNAAASASSSIKVPDSFPTPPHLGAENAEIEPVQQGRPTPMVVDDNAIMPSSPEPEPDNTVALEDRIICERLFLSSSLISSGLSALPFDSIKSEPNDTALSIRPQSPVFGNSINFEDPDDDIEVTICFKEMSQKAMRKSMSMLSKAIGYPIPHYKQVQEDDNKTMVVHNKKENVKNEFNRGGNTTQGTAPHSLENPQDEGKFDASQILNHRNCNNCGRYVMGNGVRKPLCELEFPDLDIIYCNKQCYFESEFQKKPVAARTQPPSPKKKWKASQFYKCRTDPIKITDLIEQSSSAELETSRNSRSSFGLTASVPVAVDGDSNSSTAATTGLKVDGSPRLMFSEGKGRGRGRRKCSTNTAGDDGKSTQTKRHKGIKWKRWTAAGFVNKPTVQKTNMDAEALLNKYGVAIKPPADLQDTRRCVLCGRLGDGDTDGVARLLNVDVDQWVHLNCALWSCEVYEIQCGALINVDLAIRHSSEKLCGHCQKRGATIQCNRARCLTTYHCGCALEVGCHFLMDKTVLCPLHAIQSPTSTVTHTNEQLTSLAVFRKVYVQRQETKQIASIMQQGEFTQGEKNYILRVGALMFHAVGQLSTHQMTSFHTKTAILPVGYKATRIYWASNNTRKRCKYICMITEKDGLPWFTTRYQAVAARVKAQEKPTNADWVERANGKLNEQWQGLLDQLAEVRVSQKMLKLFTKYINGESVFGLNSPVVCRILESLPNIELCSEYKFRYGRSPLLELPLAINPTGSARSEPHIKQTRKKAHTLISNLISECYEWTGIGSDTSIYVKHFFHSKSSQYRRMKQEWRNNVYLARSRIQGLGLFASRDIDPGVMVIEYIGEIIRSEVAEKREKQYESANRGVYMFRLDSDYIVDATVCGGPARYINHSCNPNCVAEVVNFDKEKKIMIISNRQILKGEELNYDYKFDFEDEGSKIPCMCGAINCRKWMN